MTLLEAKQECIRWGANLTDAGRRTLSAYGATAYARVWASARRGAAVVGDAKAWSRSVQDGLRNLQKLGYEALPLGVYQALTLRFDIEMDGNGTWLDRWGRKEQWTC